MNIDKLLDLRFKDTSYEDQGEKFTEYTLERKGLSIVISGETLVEITTGKDVWITVPNCKTLTDLENLIHLFNLKK